MSNLLLVEDDEVLGRTLKQRLEAELYNVFWVRTNSELKQLIQAKPGCSALNNLSLVIMDVGLPDASGLDIARDLKLHAQNLPVIFLSALSSAPYRLEGFELGADDYIPKPFHLRELLLRIRKVLERKDSRSSSIRLDKPSLSLILPGGRRHPLSQRDFSLMALLLENSPNVLSRKTILQHLAPADTKQSGRSIDNSIVRLRQLLRPAGCDFIRSVRGVGYCWRQDNL